jgi:hypothetical protein
MPARQRVCGRKSQRIFRDFIDAVARVTIDERQIAVRFQRRAHKPLAARSRLCQGQDVRTVAQQRAAAASLRATMVCTDGD